MSQYQRERKQTLNEGLLTFLSSSQAEPKEGVRVRRNVQGSVVYMRQRALS